MDSIDAEIAELWAKLRRWPGFDRHERRRNRFRLYRAVERLKLERARRRASITEPQGQVR